MDFGSLKAVPRVENHGLRWARLQPTERLAQFYLDIFGSVTRWWQPCISVLNGEQPTLALAYSVDFCHYEIHNDTQYCKRLTEMNDLP